MINETVRIISTRTGYLLEMGHQELCEIKDYRMAAHIQELLDGLFSGEVYSEKDAKIEDLEQQLEDLREEYHSNTIELEDLEQKVKELESELEDLKGEHHLEIVELEKENDGLRQRLMIYKEFHGNVPF